jgi:transposase-like protein
MDKKKRQQFSLKEKREILLEVEKGGIAKKYGISPSTLSTFLKQKSKIEQNIDADFLLSRSDVPESVLNSCAVVGDYLERSFVSGSVHRKITDSFKK